MQTEGIRFSIKKHNTIFYKKTLIPAEFCFLHENFKLNRLNNIFNNKTIINPN